VICGCDNSSVYELARGKAMEKILRVP